MIEFFAGYLLGSHGKSRKPDEPLSADDEKHLVLGRVALLLAMAITLAVSVAMLMKGPAWNPVEAFLSYMPGGWQFWIASGLTAIATGFLALIRMPLAGILFGLTLVVMWFAAAPLLVSLIIP